MWLFLAYPFSKKLGILVLRVHFALIITKRSGVGGDIMNCSGGRHTLWTPYRQVASGRSSLPTQIRPLIHPEPPLHQLSSAGTRAESPPILPGQHYS